MRTLQIEDEETGDGFCFETDATPRIGEEVVVFSNSLRDVIVEIEGTVIKADWSFVTGSDDDITYTVIVRPPNKDLCVLNTGNRNLSTSTELGGQGGNDE